MIYLLLLILLALFSEGFFSGAETAFISVNFLKLTHLIEKKNKRAMRVHNLLKKPERLLITTLIGTNISVVISSACATVLFSQISKSYSALMATIVMTPLSFIFCQLLPKTIFRNRANQIVLQVAGPLSFIEKLFLPLVSFFSFFAKSVAKIVNPRGVKKNPFLTKDEIKSLIKDISKEGVLEVHEKDAIEEIFDLTLTKAADVMVSLEEAVRVDFSEGVESIKQKCRAHRFTRFPVFDGEQLKGVINVFDIFFFLQNNIAGDNQNWHNLIRSIIRVDSSESLDKVFAKMQPNKETMAAVFKGGKAVGIITMEDLMEDIEVKLTSLRTSK
ncbi:MAG: CNNM domain-containing protein [Candidatus Omnitrophota bacterium]